MSSTGPNLPGIYTGYYPPEYAAYNSQYQGNIETIGWKWWDTQQFLSGTTTSLTQWFTTRTSLDLSNMEVQFQLAAPKAFLIRAVRMFIKARPTSITASAVGGTVIETGLYDDVAQIMNTGVMQLTIGNKVYNMEPLWCVTAGGGAFGVLTTGSYAQNGVADPRAVNTLSKPIFIGPQINFTARIDWAAALTVAYSPNITLLLDGDLLRPVQ